MSRRRILPALLFSNNVRYQIEGGTNFLTTEPLLSMQEWASVLAGRNACSPRPDDIAFSAPVAVERYNGCAGSANADVEYL
jgi:hypothetical protein